MKIRVYFSRLVAAVFFSVLLAEGRIVHAGDVYATGDNQNGLIEVNVSGITNDYPCGVSANLFETKEGVPGETLVATLNVSSAIAKWSNKVYRSTGVYTYKYSQPRKKFNGSNCLDDGTTLYLSNAVHLVKESPGQLDNLRPFVSINSPAAGQNLISGTAYPVTVSASDVGGSISKVVLRDGSDTIATIYPSSGANFSSTWTPSTASDGVVSKVLTATAYDNQGASTSVSQTFSVSRTGSVATTNQSIDFNKYDVFYGDFNADGNINDIYLYGRDTFILLYGDVSVPIILQGPPSYVFYEKSDHSHDDAEILEYANKSWQSSAQKAAAQDVAQGDLTGDGTADLLVRGRSQYDTALLINGKLVKDGADFVPTYLGDIDSDGRIYTRGKGWSANPVVNGNLSDRNQAISLSNGKLTVAGKLYVYNASSTLVPDAGTAASNSNVPVPPAPIYAQPTLNTEQQRIMDSLGVLSGQFRVSEAGAATYNLPLKLPQGTAGVAPQIGVGYSSQSGDGLLGVGWSLDAGGAISRCRQTVQIDKSARPITWDQNDRYCLNGQRLLLVSGVEGAKDAVYKTEIDSFVTVKILEGTAGSPDYFEVRGKDGSVSIYGGSGVVESESLAYPSTDKILSWSISQFSDSAGNKINYKYERNENHHLLAEVSYAYGGGSTPNARVVFEYAPRKEKSVYSVAGFTFYNDSLLKKITAYQNVSGSEAVLRQYNFMYDNSNVVSYSDNKHRLTEVYECVQEGPTCLPPLQIVWGEYPANTALVSATTTAINLRLNSKPNLEPVFLDINGDGIQDTAWLYKNQSNNYSLSYAIQTKSGEFTNGGSFDLGKAFDADDTVAEAARRVKIVPIDVNLDGRMDVAVFKKNLAIESFGSWSLYLATPAASQNYAEQWKLEPATFSFPFGAENIQVADVNADGTPDVLYADNSRIYVSELRRVDGATGKLSFAFGVPYIAGDAIYGLVGGTFKSAGDFDGDGEADFVGMISSASESDGKPASPPWLSGDWKERTCTVRFSLFLAKNSHPANGLVAFGVGQTIHAGSLSYVAGMFDANSTGTRPQCDKKIQLKPQFLDISKDGVLDLVWPSNPEVSAGISGITYVLGKGNGEFHSPVTVNFGITAVNFSFQDIQENGSLQLVVQPRVDSGSLKASPWSIGAPLSFTEIITDNVTPDGVNPPPSNLIFDKNGDGSLDRIRLYKGNLEVASGPSRASANLVTRFITGQGIATDITYEPLNTTKNYKPNDISRTTASGCGTHTVNYSSPSGGGSYSYNYCTNPSTVNATSFYASIAEPFASYQNQFSLNIDDKTPVLEYTASVPVVTLVSSSSPIEGSLNEQASVAYHYEQAKIQAGGRGLLGFKKLTTIDIQTQIATTTTYRQDWPFIGSPDSTVTTSKDGNKLSESVNTYSIYGIAANTESNTNDSNRLSKKRAAALANGTKALGPIQVYTSQSLETTYDLVGNGSTQGGLLAQTLTSTTNDEFGNVTQLTVSTRDSEGELAVKETVNTYGDEPAWKSLGRLMASTVTSKRRGQSNKILSSKFGYFGVTASDGLTCSRSSDKLKGMLCNEMVVQSGVATEHYYDDFGNKAFSYSQGGGLSRLSALTQYDSTGRFPEASFSVFNAPGGNTSSNSTYNSLAPSAGGRVFKVSEVVQRDKHGIALQTHNYTSGNSYVVSRTAVTPMGIPFFTADSSGASQQIATNSDITNCPSGSVYSTTKTVGGGAETRVCFNKVGQELRGMTKGFDGNWVYVDKQYDVLGRVVKSSEPYKPGGTAYYTEVESYDILGRPGKTLLPFNVTSADGTETNTRASTTVTYSGFTQTMVNPAGNSKVEVKNALGQTISVTEPHGANSEAVKATYSYDALGNLVSLADHNGNTSTLGYDALGRKTSMSDPDKGNLQYRYNAFGELVCQQDAKGQIQTTQYDFAGRPTLRMSRDPGGDCNGTPNGAVKAQSEWIYDTAPYGLGKAEVERDSISGFARTYGYDAFGRATLTTTTFNGANGVPSSHYEKVTYDQYGRVFQTFDAARQGKDFSRNGVQNTYTNQGFLAEVKDATGNDVYYRVNAADARGNITNYQLGGVTTAEQVFNAKTGRLETITTTGAAGVKLEQYTAKWDVLGNLASRSETKYINTAQNWTESFSYDKANRLRSNTFTPNGGSATTVTVGYDAIGNITSKSDVGTYAYSRQGAGPHAVTSAGGNSYTYDANGSMTATTGADARTVTYTTDDQAQIITKGDQRSSFFYGPDKARYKRVDTKISTNASTTTLYIGGVEKIYYPDGTIEWKRNIAGVGQITIKVDANGNEQSSTTHYFHKDHLGSILYISDRTGAIVQEMAYDPWGQRRTVSSPSPLSLSTLQSSYFKVAKPVTQRGFTGHEMIDEVGIIHMNGRIYDAKLGRFMQADPIIQDPTSIASLNRYSYAWNNPLNATDPSGFIKIRLGHIGSDLLRASIRLHNKIFGADVVNFFGSMAFSILGGPLGAAYWTYEYARAMGVSRSDAFKGAAISYFSAQAFTYIGDKFNGTGWLKQGGAGHILAHATTGGVIEVLQGGKFGHGFVSAGLTKAININRVMSNDAGFTADMTRSVLAGIAGGTISEITGGKFKNGAMTAAMAQMFNGNPSLERDLGAMTGMSPDQVKGQWGAMQKNITKLRDFAKASWSTAISFGGWVAGMVEGGEASSGAFMSFNKYGYPIDLGGFSSSPIGLTDNQSTYGLGGSIGASVFGWKGGVNELEGPGYNYHIPFFDGYMNSDKKFYGIGSGAFISIGRGAALTKTNTTAWSLNREILDK